MIGWGVTVRIDPIIDYNRVPILHHGLFRQGMLQLLMNQHMPLCYHLQSKQVGCGHVVRRTLPAPPALFPLKVMLSVIGIDPRASILVIEGEPPINVNSGARTCPLLSSMNKREIRPMIFCIEDDARGADGNVDELSVRPSSMDEKA